MNLGRIFRTVAAHGVGQVITIASTVVVPLICLKYWDLETYTIFVLAGAASQFAMYLDFGRLSAMTNKVVMSQSNLFCRSGVFFDYCKRYLRLVCFPALIVLPICAAFVIRSVDTRAGVAMMTLAFVFVSVLFHQGASAVVCYFRAIGRVDFSVLLNNISRLGDLFVVLILAPFFDVYVVGLALLFYKAGLFLLAKEFLKSIEKQNPGQSILFDVDVVKSGLGLALSGVSNNLILQGFVLIAGLAGAGSAAVFAAGRTMSRISWQPLVVMTQTISCELTYCYETNKRQFIILSMLGFGFSLVVPALSGVAVILYKEKIEAFWLSGKVSVPEGFLILLVSVCVISSITQSLMSILNSVNKNYFVGAASVPVSAVSAAFAVWAVFFYGITGVAMVWLFHEMVMFFVTVLFFVKSFDLFESFLRMKK